MSDSLPPQTVTKPGTSAQQAITVQGSATGVGIPVTFAAGTSVTINDPTITTQKMAVDAAGKIGINNFPAGALEAGHLATIDTSTAKIPAQGQALAAASMPVVLTAIQQTALTPPAAITGFALEAGHLATIDTSTAKIPAQGQALAAASLPVVLTAAQITTLTPLATVAVTQATPASLQATVTQLALTKGTQGATGVSTQDLKDAGRTVIMWTAEFSPAAVAEAMLVLTESRNGAAVTTPSSVIITSGKRMRITSISMQVENTLGTSLQRAYLRMRFNTAGAVTTASPQQTSLAVQAIGTVKSIGSGFDDYPDGIEFLGDGTKQIGFSLTAPDWVSVTSTLKVYVSIFAFEY